jgi:RNA polymerase sigma-70 factor (ECF subfamily)
VSEAIAPGRASDDPAEVALVERAQTGDPVAFDALVGPRLERLLRLAMAILGNEPDARDAVQDGCLLAWRELPRLRDSGRFEAWLWQIVINRCRTALRGRWRTQVREMPIESIAPGDEPPRSGRSLGDEVSAADAIRRAFARIDVDKRTLLVLHHVDDRSIDEIATLLRIPGGTVKWRLHAARRALERALEVERR